MSFDIQGIVSAFPKKARYSSKSDKTVRVTGINKRFFSQKDEDSLSLAKKCLIKTKNKYNLNKINFFLVVTQTSPLNFPSLSNILQKNFSIPENAFVLDINLGCSGYVYALKLAESLMLTGGFKNGIILTVDTYTKFISKKNKSCYPIFSDACTVTILKKNLKKNKFHYHFGSDGSGSKDLYLKKKDKDMFMNGANVALFTFKVIPNFVNNFINLNSYNKKDFKYFLFHQASKFVCDNINQRLILNKDQIYNNYQKYGNTISSSIPLLLMDLFNKKLLKKSDQLILCGFGVGLSWGIMNYKI